MVAKTVGAMIDTHEVIVVYEKHEMEVIQYEENAYVTASSGTGFFSYDSPKEDS